ncbi:GNAT family N-acetyltransferase [Tunturibacter psychrotolerans]|uniref:GNAT family N-acetyltransferase n=1 Tax=Tunturiibacter psychrotolerans TaxID=3069686 RepID=A0AAU7ZVQ7_9BACT
MPLATQAVPSIPTARLELVAITPESLTSEQTSDGKLGQILNCRVTSEWPHADWEPHVLQLLQQTFAEDPTDIGWHRYVLLRAINDQPATLIGSVGGFRWPDNHQAAEVGYAILPAFRLHGYAIEATKAMIAWIEATNAVKTIFAHTFPHLAGSIRILEQCGFTLEGPGKEENTIRYRKQ